MCPSDAPGHGPAERLLPDLLARADHAVNQGFAEELRRRGTTPPVWRVLGPCSPAPARR